MHMSRAAQKYLLLNTIFGSYEIIISKSILYTYTQTHTHTIHAQSIDKVKDRSYPINLWTISYILQPIINNIYLRNIIYVNYYIIFRFTWYNRDSNMLFWWIIYKLWKINWDHFNWFVGHCGCIGFYTT